jgi:hypothetical protein
VLLRARALKRALDGYTAGARHVNTARVIAATLHCLIACRAVNS